MEALTAPFDRTQATTMATLRRMLRHSDGGIPASWNRGSTTDATRVTARRISRQIAGRAYGKRGGRTCMVYQRLSYLGISHKTRSGSTSPPRMSYFGTVRLSK
jgi:hypothetical protein